MKRSAILFFSVAIGLLGTNPGLAQIRNPLKKIEKKSVEKIEEGIGGLFNKNKKNTEEEKEVQTKETVPEVDGSVQKTANTSSDTPSVSKEKPTLSWAKYDFVPGDKIKIILERMPKCFMLMENWQMNVLNVKRVSALLII